MEKGIKVLKDISLVILLILPIAIIALTSELVVGDELWNFQNIMKMINGGKLYIDANAIITPIFYVLGKMLLYILGANILGFRIYNVLIYLFLSLSSFGIFKAIKCDKISSVIYTLFLLLFILPYISVGANYNVLAIAIYFIGIIVCLYKDKIKYYNILQGLIIFLVIFTKQNIGLLYLLAYIIVNIYTDKKASVHCIIRSITIMLVLSLIATLIMLYQNIFDVFLNYTVLGMKEFTTNNLQLQEKLGIVISIFGIIAVISYILLLIRYKKNKSLEEEFVILSIFAIGLNFSAFPIFNIYHTSFAILINIILMLVILEEILGVKFQKRKCKIVSFMILYILINSFCINYGIKNQENIKIEDKKEVYYNANISEELNNNLKEVSEYIVEKEKDEVEVICISSDAALYMTYLNKNNQELDLIFDGNLGYNGKEIIIDKIDSLENTQILMNKDIYWQEITELRMYIIQNYEKIGEVGNCHIFQKD